MEEVFLVDLAELRMGTNETMKRLSLMTVQGVKEQTKSMLVTADIVENVLLLFEKAQLALHFVRGAEQFVECCLRRWVLVIVD